MRCLLDEVLSTAGVAAFSARSDDVLLWSHYADAHAGVCLCFDTEPGRYFGAAQSVRYQREQPIVNIIKDKLHEVAEKAILVKADYWSYEEEWRMVEIPPSAPGLHAFPARALAGIILGARTSDADREEVRSWVRDRPSPVTLYQARFDDRAFRLNIVVEAS